MPVISPRRSSTSGSSSLYGTTSLSTATGSSASSYGSSSYGSTSSYRSGSLNKPSTSLSGYSSNYSSNLNSYSSYTPRSTSTYRSYLSGGSGSSLGTYRSNSLYSGIGSNDTTSSRYGLNRRPKSSTSTLRNKDDDTNSTEVTKKKPPSGSENNSSDRASKRLSGTPSSSSLARLVATSGLEMYEKYSPAHYKPNSELSRSSSVTNDDPKVTDNDDAVNITIDKPRKRYSRYFNDSDSDAVDNAITNSNSGNNLNSISRRSSHRSSGKLRNSSSGTGLSNSNSNSDVPTATFTLRSNRLKKTYDDDVPLVNGNANELGRSPSVTTNGLDATQHQLKDLKLSASSSGSALALTAPSKSPSSNSLNKLDVANSHENNDVNASGATNGDVRTGTTSKSILSSSPSTSRYWDRDTSSRPLSTLSSSIYNHSEESNKLSGSDEKSEGLCGLRNIGNTCFMNSVIQCLSNTSELTKFMRSQNATRSSSSTKDQQILFEFAKLIREMWSSNVNSVTPSELKRAFSAKHRMYSDHSQQDAQEFLRFFLDSLHCALNLGVKCSPLNIDENLSDNKKAELTWEWYTRTDNSLIRDLFVGQLKSTLTCTVCGNTSVTFDPFWDLSVPLPSSSRCRLDSCLDLFIREEVLDGDEMPTCARCKTRRKCTKSFAIQKFPKYLVIHLKRFSETRWSKLSNMVEFPTGERELNMAPYGTSPHSNIYYSLYAVSNHMGSTANGHYVAICKHPNTRKWHEFNDNIVSETLSESRLVSSSAYILFYERA